MARPRHLDPPAREDLLETLSALLAARDDILVAYAHGSFLRGEPFRDIDVAVWTAPGAGARLDLELAVSLSRRTGYRVDVRIVNHAPIAFVYHALRGRPLAVRDERHLADLIERTARAYHDQAPLARRATREAFSA